MKTFSTRLIVLLAAFAMAAQLGAQCGDTLNCAVCTACAAPAARMELASLSLKAPQSPEVLVQTPSGVPLVLSNIAPKWVAGPTGSSLLGITYTVTNRSPEPLMAWDINWDVYSTQDKGGQSPNWTSSSTTDRWYGKNNGMSPYLAPGASATESNTVQITSGSPIVRIVGRAVYAEFTDGKRVGPAAAKVYPKLEQRRQASVAAYAEALQEYETGGMGALQAWLKAGDPKTETSPHRAIRGFLAYQLRQNGIQGVLANIHRFIPKD